jgi:ABC-2 type transport system permease protein
MSGAQDSSEPQLVYDHAISTTQRLANLWRYRPLLVALVRKDLKVRYNDSILGFLWSMLTPAATLIVFYFVFQRVMQNAIPAFAIFLVCGIVVWNLFSTALIGSAAAIVGNAGIVRTVPFPREMLVLAAVGASFVHFLLQCVVVIPFLVAFRHAPDVAALPLLLPALICVVTLATALGLFVAAANVHLRDTQYLLDVVLLVWFWATPIVYQYRLVGDNAYKQGALYSIWRVNPLTPVVLAFQRAVYGDVAPRGLAVLPDEGQGWYLAQLGLVMVVAVAFAAIALVVFARLESSFVEEL